MPSFIDRTGTMISVYTVVKQDGWYISGKKRYPLWLFKCQCGDTFTAQFHQVSNGVRSCNKCRRARCIEDLSGRMFGLLVVTKMARSNPVLWSASCSKCGSTFNRKPCNLKRISVCPCHSHSKHGHASNGKASRTYKTWNGMINRCRYPSSPGFARYGGRGIKVCDRWLSFENFIADMGERPLGKTLDRIDGDGNYEPNNCRWATSAEQRRNTRANTLLTYSGETKTLAEWADKLGIKRHTLRFRYVRKGWSAERALEEPVGANVGRRAKTTT